MSQNSKEIVLVGAGLVGSLLSISLAKRGYRVKMLERRTDPRAKCKDGTVGEGRSINLAISCRGLNALESVDLAAPVIDRALPMTGRQMHSVDSELTYQAYGQDENQYINSISRGWLNCFLLDEAEKTGQVEIHFNHKLLDIDFTKKKASFLTEKEEQVDLHFDKLIATDGSSSMARKSLAATMKIDNHEDYLSHGYKELLMTAKPNGDFRIDKNALHIWPRGRFMMIALPNFDGSFTCTLFLSHKTTETDPESFEKLMIDEDVRTFFQRFFPDFCELVPDYLEQFNANPTGRMVTLKCGPWNHQEDVLLMGDASHAIVPFFGQGMNSGFEDVFEFAQLLDRKKTWEGLFRDFYTQRKPQADAIADMALENFIEMSAKTADEKFLYQKKVEKKLQAQFPDYYVSRYSLVSFSNTPYKLAFDIGEKQKALLRAMTEADFPQVKDDYSDWKNQLVDDLEELMKNAKRP